MSAKVIKLQDNSNNTLLPVTDASLVQMTVDTETKSVQEVILEDEEATAAGYNELNDRLTALEEAPDYITQNELSSNSYITTSTETQLSKGTTTGSGNAVTDISVSGHQITLTKGTTFLTNLNDQSKDFGKVTNNTSGFKDIITYTAPLTTAGTATADTTQDTLNVYASNYWIRTNVTDTSNNDVLTIGHSLASNSVTSTSKTLYGNETIISTSYNFDFAGHRTGTHNTTYTLSLDASYINITYNETTKSVKDAILENEEVTAIALNELNDRVDNTIETVESTAPLIVNISPTLGINGIKCDTSIDDIQDAYYAGKNVIARTVDGQLNLVQCNSSSVIFTNSHTNTIIYYIGSKVNNNDQWTITTTSLDDYKLKTVYLDLTSTTSGNTTTYYLQLNGVTQTYSQIEAIYNTGADIKVRTAIAPSSSAEKIVICDLIARNTTQGSFIWHALVTIVFSTPLIFISINTSNTVTVVTGDLANFQEKLVSGTNIKTINSASLLGSGNIELNASNIEVQNGDTIQDSIDSLYNSKQDKNFIIIAQDVQGEFTADKTYAEVLNAYNDGKNVIVKYNIGGGYIIHNMTEKNSTNFEFIHIHENSVNTLSQIVVSSIIVEETDGWNMSVNYLQNRLTFDNTPTSGSANPVTSGGVKTYVDNSFKNSVIFAQCSTNSSTQGATMSVTDSSYVAKGGAIITIYFRYAVPDAAKLNINSIGAKQMIMSAADSFDTQIMAGVIKAGDIATFMYTGSSYKLINVSSIANPNLICMNVSPTSGAMVFDGSSTEKTLIPNKVYYISGDEYSNFSPITSLNIENAGLGLQDTMYYDVNITSTEKTPYNNFLLPVYQIFFKTGSLCSITLGNKMIWKDNLAPTSSDLSNKYCELTIMNKIVTLISVDIPT